MEKELKNLFYKAKYEENSDLAESVWHNIVVREKRITRIKLWGFSLIGATSLIGFIPAWKSLSTDFSQSGLYEYFSLAFSSGSSISLYWKELIFSIAESLPTMSIAFSLSLIFILFLSLKYMSKQIIKGQLLLSVSF